jgi:hypothetical protein
MDEVPVFERYSSVFDVKMGGIIDDHVPVSGVSA